MVVTGSGESARRTQRERREQTRARLVTATITCLAEHGYPATTTRRVAEIADVSLGALAHHFPSRLALVTSTLDEVSRRMSVEMPAHPGADPDPFRVLDALWALFSGELFTVWVKVWVAAAEDPELYAALVPLEARIAVTISEAVAAAAPTSPPQRSWTSRMGVVLDAMRGRAFIAGFQPRPAEPNPGRWPVMRSELAAVLTGDTATSRLPRSPSSH